MPCRSSVLPFAALLWPGSRKLLPRYNLVPLLMAQIPNLFLLSSVLQSEPAPNQISESILTY